MIDIHCHILPGIDDGPATLEEAVAMCRVAAEDGITTIVATPHFKPGRFDAPAAQVTEKMDALSEELGRQKIVLRLLPGSDVTVLPELSAYLKREPRLSINGTPYFLAELPHDSVPPRWDSFLLSLLDHGQIPILTHPERNRWFLNHPDALYRFVLRGGLVQITAMSLTGQFGAEAREFCLLLLRHNLVHAIATDAHDGTQRAPILSDAVNRAADEVGRDKALMLVTSIPQAIIDHADISLPLPIPLSATSKRKTWLQRLSLS